MATPIAEAYVQIRANTEPARQAIEGLRSSFAKLAAAVGGLYALKKAGEKLLDTYTAFDREMRNVWTLMDVSEKQMRAIAAQVEELGVRYGQMGAQALKAYYQVVSASFTGAKGIKVLETSMKAAAAGVTDVFTAADALTSILNAYGLSAEEATRVSDVLFTVVKRGKTTMGELAATTGRLTGIAAPAGVSLEELGAALATLTRAGLGTDEAVTAVRAAIVELQKPSEALEEIIHDLGYETGVAALQSEGFLGLLQKVAARARELNIPLTDLFGNIRSMTAVLPLTGELAEEVAEDFEAMRNSAGATDEAFRKVAEGVAFQLDQLRAELTKVANQIGSVVVPVFLDFTENVLEPLVGTISKVVQGFAGIGKLVMKVVPDTEAARASLEEATAAFERTLTTFLAAWAAKRFGGRVSPGLGRLGFVIPFVVQLAGSIVAAIEEPEFGSIADEIRRALEAAIPGAAVGWFVAGPAGAAVGAALTITIPTLIRLAARVEPPDIERLSEAIEGDVPELETKVKAEVGEIPREAYLALSTLLDKLRVSAQEFIRGNTEVAIEAAVKWTNWFLEETGLKFEDISATLYRNLKDAPKAFWEAWLAEMGLSLDEFLSRLGAGVQEAFSPEETLKAIEEAREALGLEKPEIEAEWPDFERFIESLETGAEAAGQAQETAATAAQEFATNVEGQAVPSLEDAAQSLQAFSASLEAWQREGEEQRQAEASSVAVWVQQVKTGAMSVGEFIDRVRDAVASQGLSNEKLIELYEATSGLLSWFEQLVEAQEAFFGSSEEARAAVEALAELLSVELPEMESAASDFEKSLAELRFPSEETGRKLLELAASASPEELIRLRQKVAELIASASELYQAQRIFKGSTEGVVADLREFLSVLGFSEDEIARIVADITGASKEVETAFRSLTEAAEALALSQLDQAAAYREQALDILRTGKVVDEEGKVREATVGELMRAASTVKTFSTWLDATIDVLDRLVTAGDESFRPLLERLREFQEGLRLGPTAAELAEEERRRQEEARRRAEQEARRAQEEARKAFRESLWEPLQRALEAGDWEGVVSTLRDIAAQRDRFVELGTAVGATGEKLYSADEVLEMIVGLERQVVEWLEREINLRRLAGEETSELTAALDYFTNAFRNETPDLITRVREMADQVREGTLGLDAFLAQVQALVASGALKPDEIIAVYEALEDLYAWFQRLSEAQERLTGSSADVDAALQTLAAFLGIQLPSAFELALAQITSPTKEAGEYLRSLAENAAPDELVQLAAKVQEVISSTRELYEAQKLFGLSTEETIEQLRSFLSALGLSEEEIQAIVADIVGAGQSLVSAFDSLVAQAEALTLAQADQILALRAQALAVLESGKVTTDEGKVREATIGEILAAAGAVRSFSTWLDSAIETLERLITSGDEAVRPLYERLVELRESLALGPSFEEQRRAQEELAREAQRRMREAFKERLYAPVRAALERRDWDAAVRAIREIAAQRERFVKLGTAVGATGERLYSASDVLNMIISLEREATSWIEREIRLRRLAGESTAEFERGLEILNRAFSERAPTFSERLEEMTEKVKEGTLSLDAFLQHVLGLVESGALSPKEFLEVYGALEELYSWFGRLSEAQERLLGSNAEAEAAVRRLAAILGHEVPTLFDKILESIEWPSRQAGEQLAQLAKSASPEQLIELNAKVREVISNTRELYEAQKRFGLSTEETIANLEDFLRALGLSAEEIEEIVEDVTGIARNLISVFNALVAQAEELTLAQAEEILALREQALSVLESGRVVTQEGDVREATIGEILAAAGAVRSFSTWLDAAIEVLERLITTGDEAVRPLYERLVELREALELGPTLEEFRRTQEEIIEEARRRQEERAQELQEALRKAFEEQLFVPVARALEAGDLEGALYALRGIAAHREDFVRLGTAVGPAGEALFSEAEVLDMIVGLERELLDRIQREIELRRLAGESTAELEEQFEKLKEALEPLPTALEALLEDIKGLAGKEPRRAAENLRDLARAALAGEVVEAARTIRRLRLELPGAPPAFPKPPLPVGEVLAERKLTWPEEALAKLREALGLTAEGAEAAAEPLADLGSASRAAATAAEQQAEAAAHFEIGLGEVEEETVRLAQQLRETDLGQIAAAAEEIASAFEKEIQQLETFGLSTAETRWQLRQFEEGLRGASAELSLLEDVLAESAGIIRDVLGKLLPEGLDRVASSAFDLGLALLGVNWAEFEAGLAAAEAGNWAVAGEALLASNALDAFAAGLGLVFTTFEALSRWVAETVGELQSAFDGLSERLRDLSDRALDLVNRRLDEFRSRLEALITSTEAYRRFRESLAALERRVWNALLGFLWPLVGLFEALTTTVETASEAVSEAADAASAASRELEALNVPAGFKAERLEYAAARPGEPYLPPPPEAPAGGGGPAAPPALEGLPEWVQRLLSAFGEEIEELRKLFDEFSSALERLWEALGREILRAAIPALREFATWLKRLADRIELEVYPLLSEHLPGILRGFLEFFVGGVEGSIGFVLNLVAENLPALESLFAALGGVGAALAELLPRLGEELSPVLGSLIEGLTLFATWIGETLLPKVGEWAEQLGKWWEEEVAPFLEAEVFPKLQEWLTEVLEFIEKNVLPFLENRLWPFVENRLWPTIEKVVDKLIDFLDRYWPQIEDWLMTELERWLTNLERQIDLGTAYFLSQVGRTFDALDVIMRSESLYMWEKIQYTIALVLQDIGRAIASFFSSPWTWLGIGLGALLLLQEGGVVTRPTVAALAERGRPEDVIPLDRLPEMLFGFQAELRPAAFVIEVPVKIDGREVARAVRKVEFEERLLRGRW